MDDSFETWLEQVDAVVQGTIGLSVHDLPDQDFRSMFDDGMEPAEAAAEILENEGIDAE